MLNRIRHSLSAKLIVLFICAGVVLLLLVGSIMGKGFARHFRFSIQPFMIHYINLMQQQLGSPPELQQAQRITRDIPVDIHVFGPEQNWSTADSQLDRSALIETFDQRRSVNPKTGARNARSWPDRRFRLKRVDGDLILHTAEGDHDIYFQIRHRRDIGHGGRFSFFILFAILAVLLLIYYATRALFRPIDDINRGVKQFSVGNLAHRISKRRNDQLGDLTDSVNQMAEDISNMLEAKRQLLLSISHELRSPLTRSKINLALMHDSAAKSEIDQDIQAMDQLISELLESERLNSPHKIIQPETTDLHALIAEVVESEFGHQTISVELQSVTANVDPARIKLLVRNLLRNAIKYNDNEKSAPKVSLTIESRRFTIAVRDYGAGIASQHIPFLTEPFYRADPSRQRMTGGYGLGLYLCRMIVEAHGGHIEIESNSGNDMGKDMGKGTRVRCRFPLSGDTEHENRGR
ncbi:sensor histidine kinase [Candidatus Spongiihabitans sp.]|uniref:sensor histidine kinase n=1 Tax=Candidatus Spongiihabitans sp. TaxID=3101308 RepID=UPI003C7DDBC9